MPTPDMHALTEGRFGAMCGGCLRHSDPVTGLTTEDAWDKLVALGWTLYRSKAMANAREYALCPKCTADPPDVDKDAAAARKRRKRK